LHPAPRLVVGEAVVEFDGAPQVAECVVELPFAISDFAVEHFARDGQDVAAVLLNR
jgi:hypothetical protein